MNLFKSFRMSFVYVPIILFPFLIYSPLCAAPLQLQVEPNLIQIGAFFNGATINLSAEIPKNCSVIVQVSGKETEEIVVEKVRRFGLWMNGEQIIVKGAPNFYLVMTSAPKEAASANIQSSLEYKSLKKSISFSGNVKENENDHLFKEFVLLKESLHLYGIFPETLKISPTSRSKSTVLGTFQLPSKIPPGHYQVSLTVIDEGQILINKSVPLDIVMVGFPKLVLTMAKKHSVAYGMFAIAIAIIAGLVVGRVFAKKQPADSTEL